MNFRPYGYAWLSMMACHASALPVLENNLVYSSQQGTSVVFSETPVTRKVAWEISRSVKRVWDTKLHYANPMLGDSLRSQDGQSPKMYIEVTHDSHATVRMELCVTWAETDNRSKCRKGLQL